jgi:hypothetical protein
MGGGLMQLVAHGAQDVYLTGNADITFFKVVYRRHTNFAVEAIEQTFNGTANFGNKVTVTVSRNADLITRAYLQVTLPALPTNATAWVDEVGHFLVNNVSVDIGGQQIDKHYGEWLSIWASLVVPAGQIRGYDAMIGNVGELTGISPGYPGTAAPEYTVYVPLRFWFNNNIGLALPLIALQYHEVKLNVEFNTLANVTRGTIPSVSFVKASIYLDYVYLARDERRRFAQSAHEYLIEQLQYSGSESLSASQATTKLRLNFNHPVKELIWVIQAVDATDNTAAGASKQQNNLTDVVLGGGANPVKDALVRLNGHDRFSVRDGAYFNYVQPYQHHTSTPPDGVNIYSFCEKPEEHQPSGSANFSRIDNAELSLTRTTLGAALSAKLRVYATNYNVLRIMSGMGGLAFAN